MTETEGDFCGYVCGPELDKIKSFVETLRPLLKVNPELVKVMIGKARNEIYLLEEDIWRQDRKAKQAPNEVICSYCRGGPIVTDTRNSMTIWTCEQCGKSDYL